MFFFEVEQFHEDIFLDHYTKFLAINFQVELILLYNINKEKIIKWVFKINKENANMLKNKHHCVLMNIRKIFEEIIISGIES